MWFLTLLLGALVLYLINYWVNSHFEDWKKRGIPYSKSTSPFKMIFQFLFTKKGLFELMTEDYKRFEGHKFAGYFQMFSPGIMIRDPDLVHQICIKDFSYFVDRNLPTDITDLFSESVGSLTGDKWRTLRHKLTPTFTSGKLKMMFDSIRECGDEAVNFIDKKIGKDIDSRDFTFKYSINVIGKVAFGLNVDALNEEAEENNEFLNISRSFFKPSFMLMMKFMISMTMPKVRKFIKFSLVEDKIDKFFRKLVKDMIAHREKTGEVRQDFLQLMLDQQRKEQEDSHSGSLSANKNSTDSSKHQSDDLEDKELLDQLKNMHNGNDNYKNIKVFSDESIVAQTFMFISAGSETVAAALSFILFELAVNPVYQKKLQQEVDDEIAKNGFTYNAVRNMKYMEQVMNESLRLHTVAAFLGRICTQDYKIPDTDVIIQKGTFIGMAMYGINLDPQYFPDPEKFDPDRFEDPDSIHPAMDSAFGVGPRMCIAKRLAILEVKILLAAVMQRFTVTLSKKTKMPLKMQKASVFQHIEGGVWIQFERRK